MKIIVCMKQVPDPSASSTGTTVDSEAKKVILPQGTPPVLNPYDENALEAALKIKDAQGAQVTVISAGRNLAKPVLRKSIAVGADELILLEDAAFGNLNSYATAHLLAAAIREVGEYDLILCGRQAADTDAGQVGSGIAQILNVPCITAACKLELSDGKALVERVVSDGIEEVEAPLPAVVTASSEIGDMRYPGVKEIMAAQKVPITVRKAQDLECDVSQLKRPSLVSMASPPGRKTECQFIEAETPEEAGVDLAVTVRDAQLL
ncbi:MAG: electron transfer flavoprotein subunit beta/FixA family protein [Deltaproteobacteria bacterium]|nr:electron transfer flavoprotein subunit beta/FixA family protein [Deltaproteobacteria bacterium]